MTAAARLLALPVLLLPLAVAAQTPPNAAPEATLQACFAELQPAARAAGVTPETWQRHTAGLAALPDVLDKLDQQPEFRTPIWDYLAALVDDERVAQGLAMLEQHRQVLDEVAQRHGADPATVVAPWGA